MTPEQRTDQRLQEMFGLPPIGAAAHATAEMPPPPPRGRLIGYKPFEHYAARAGINWSTLKEMAKSPLHYRHAVEGERDVTDAMIDGAAAHSALFEPREFIRRYRPWSGKVRNGKEWEKFKAEAEADGGTTILARGYERAAAIADAVRKHPLAAPLLEGVTAEQTLVWTDADTGLGCKCRLDLGVARIVELKTSAKVDEYGFGSIATRLMYHGQLAYQHNGVYAATGKSVDCWVIAVEQGEPHDIAVYQVLPDQVAKGEDLVRTLLTRLKACMETDTWPGQYGEVRPFPLQPWAADGAAGLSELDEQALMEAYGQ